MQTRHAVLLLALVGSFGAAALAIATHRTRLSLEIAQRVGGEDARNAIQATARFGHMQELGFLALALIFLALFLMHMSLKTEAPRVSTRVDSATNSIPRSLAPSTEAPIAPVVPAVPEIAPLPASTETAVATKKEESAAPHG